MMRWCESSWITHSTDTVSDDGRTNAGISSRGRKSYWAGRTRNNGHEYALQTPKALAYAAKSWYVLVARRSYIQ